MYNKRLPLSITLSGNSAMNTFIKYGSKKIDITVSRRRRKTLGISVSVTKGVQVAAPINASDDTIHQILSRKAPWIIEKLSHLHEIESQTPIKGFVTGDVFPYLGKDYILEITENPNAKKASVSLDNNRFNVVLPETLSTNNRPEIIRDTFILWYKKKAKEILALRIEKYSQELGVVPTALVIKGQKTIWGSCTADNKININWKILMAPLDIIDYLVVHELSHIRVKNHSKNFWSLVESILPSYRELSGWLKQNGHKLNF
jgi:predicted metal-dependent hydrolase